MKFDKGTGKLTKFKNWFFRGRIEKKIIREKRISDLSKEYDNGEIIKIG